MTAITNLPDLRPSLLLDFANSGRVDPRIQFTRASSATCFGPDGKLRTVAANVPRIDYDPVTGKCLGLLVEEARTNLLAYSEQFDAGWDKNETVVTSNITTSPDGALTADKLVETAINSGHILSRAVTVTAGSVLIFSVYAKAAERSIFNLRISDGVIGYARKFNLDNGTSNLEDVASTSEAAVFGMESVGDGWYRCYVGCTMASGASSNIQIRLNNGGDGYTGDGTSGIYVWGAQLEAGSFPTSYIPTTDSQVTRATETALMSGTNFTSWYRQGEGTIFLDYQLGLLLRSTRALTISDNSFNNTHEAVSGSGSGVGGYFFTVSGGTAQASPSIGATNVPFARYVNAYTYKTNSFQTSRNGTVSTEDTDGILPVVDRMFIGANAVGASQLNGHISRIAYYPKRLTDTQLQRLTA